MIPWNPFFLNLTGPYVNYPLIEKTYKKVSSQGWLLQGSSNAYVKYLEHKKNSELEEFT